MKINLQMTYIIRELTFPIYIGISNPSKNILSVNFSDVLITKYMSSQWKTEILKELSTIVISIPNFGCKLSFKSLFI